MKLFRNTHAATVALESRQSYVGSPIRVLCLDVTTRWNSLYDMLNRLVQERDNIRMALAEIKQDASNLSDADWHVCEQLIKLLRPFYDITVHLSSESQLTLSLLSPMINYLVTQVRAVQEGMTHTALRLQQLLCEAIVKRLIHYLDPSSVYRHATVLDPRCKRNPVNNIDELAADRPNVWVFVQQQLEKRRTHRAEASAAAAAAAAAAVTAAAATPLISACRGRGCFATNACHCCSCIA